jgi:hypothetical protein
MSSHVVIFDVVARCAATIIVNVVAHHTVAIVIIIDYYIFNNVLLDQSYNIGVCLFKQGSNFSSDVISPPQSNKIFAFLGAQST